MAQHPFGPIENQLIVGYYKQQTNPAKLEPKFLFQDVLIPGPKAHTVYAMTNPNFYGWSPANGNSSSHDFRVTFDHTCGSPVNLLSRGLGYRITFTMVAPAVIKIETLDLFGEQVFGNTVLKAPSEKKSLRVLLNELKDYDSIVMEVTIQRIKITIDGVHDYCIPNYDLKSALTKPDVIKVTNKFKCLLLMSPPAERTAFLLMSELLLGICLHIQRTSGKLTAAQDLVLKPHVLGCTSLLAKYCAEPTHIFEREIEWAPLAESLAEMQPKLCNWADGYSDFCWDDLFKVVIRINVKLHAKLNKLGHQDRAAQEVAQKLNVRDRYYYSQMWNQGFGPGSSWLWKLIDLSPDLKALNEQNCPKTLIFHTESYELQISSHIDCRQKGSSDDLIFINTPPAFGKNLPNLRVWPITNTDRFIVGAPKKPYPWLLWVELKDKQANTVRLDPFLQHSKIFPDPDTQFGFQRLEVTRAGMHILMQATATYKSTLAALSARFADDNGAPVLESLTSFEFPSEMNYREGLDFGRLKLTRNGKHLFIAIGREQVNRELEDCGTLQTMMAKFKVNPSTLKLTLERFDKFSNELQHRTEQTAKMNTVWIENLQSRMFCCIFASSGTKLFISCFHRRRFVPVGSRTGGTLGVFETARRFKYLLPVLDLTGTTVVDVAAFVGERGEVGDRVVCRFAKLLLSKA